MKTALSLSAAFSLVAMRQYIGKLICALPTYWHHREMPHHHPDDDNNNNNLQSSLVVTTLTVFILLKQGALVASFSNACAIHLPTIVL